MLTLKRHGQTLYFDDSGFSVMPYVYQPLITGRLYEESFLEYILSLGRVGEYVDAGAHLGTHSIWFAKMCPSTRVHAFEPVERYAMIVRRNALANSVDDKTTVHQKGLAATSGRATNYMSPEHQMGFAEGVATGVTESFDVVRMDDVIQGPVAVIKIDVEGMEVDVLRGAARILSEHKPVIFAEARSLAEAKAIARHLAPFGYRPTWRIFNASPTYEFSADPERGIWIRFARVRLLFMISHARRVAERAQKMFARTVG
jgi:FkbM family methyltransferase